VQPFMVAAPLTRVIRKVAPVVLGTLREVWLHPERLPITRFNSEVSPHRVFETRRFTIDEFKRIRNLVPGATVNDAVLAVCGGALRRYLLTHDELPGPSLVSIAPLSIRNVDASAASRSGISLLRVPLGTEIEDPVRRLRSVHHHTSSADEFGQAVGAKELTDITKHAPAATLALTARLLAESSIGIGQGAPMSSCTITNVPGPSIPLYLNGARMTYFSAIMPISDGMGLVFAVTSYDGKIIISPTSCREQIPDPEFFALCIRESFQEYLELANRAKPARRKTTGGRTAKAKAPAKKAKGKLAKATRRKAA
jgi:diacylglycerol O-acyltransferase